ncbi:MAG TPA: tyrosine-type recombinase/integrase [Ktedonobacterales bacterium]
MEDDSQRTGGVTEQPGLFSPDMVEVVQAPRPSLVQIPDPTPETTLGACALPYQDYLRRTDHSPYTITCFLSDLRMLTIFLGPSAALSSLNQARLGAWLDHLRLAGDNRPAPKTMARRVTFLKNFCGWLAGVGAIGLDPSARLMLTRPAAPLPDLLFDDEVARLERAAEDDPRAQTLVMLLLSTGLKKEEVMGLALGHVDLSDPERPAVEVRFPGQAKRRRERRMELPAAWSPVYERYLRRYQPRERVFECTDRNLNYVLAAAVRRAGLEKRVTLQHLRDLYAVRQLRSGVPLDTLRERLGLSDEAWYEIAEKYRKLAFPA